MNNVKNLFFLTTLKFFLLISSITLFFFLFLDVAIYELTRSFKGFIFDFFKNIIDPLSDILDPLNIIIFCLILIFVNLNIHSILKNELKFRTLQNKTGFSKKKILDSFEFIKLICQHFIVSLASAGIICNLLKYIIGVSRPKYFFLHNYDRINPFNLEHKVNSFPSGHTQAAFTLAILIVIYTNRFAIIILIMACLMALSRIFMSMHFPSDLIFGAYVGSVVPIIIFKFYYMKEINKIILSNDIVISDLLKIMYYRAFI